MQGPRIKNDERRPHKAESLQTPSAIEIGAGHKACVENTLNAV
jgi:hypothetical protein